MTDTIETTENVFEAKARDLLLDAFTKNGAEERDGTITFEFKIADLQSDIAAALEAARLEERKACAKILMQHSGRFLRQFHEADRISLELGRVVAEVRNWAAAIRSRETDNE